MILRGDGPSCEVTGVPGPAAHRTGHEVRDTRATRRCRGARV